MTADGRSKQDPLIGQFIGERFRLIRRLGEGGMGVVYLAEQFFSPRDEKAIRKVALKILHQHYATDDEFTERFRREARLAASLSHHNIVTVYDFGQARDGSLYIAMEYVEGRNLKEIIQKTRLSVQSALHLGVQIAEGLEAAHHAGVIHRDIKPENIMVATGNSEVKIMDFGIANVKHTEGMTLTSHGMLVGTPAYMAPERINGERADEKADLYAFGIVLYEMLTGDVPFSANTPAAMLIKHLQEVPLPLKKIRTDIPASVEGIVMQALEKDPQNRQSEIGKIALALRRAQSKLAVETDIPQTLVGEWTVGRATDNIPQGRKTKRTEQKGKWTVGGATVAISVTFVLGTSGTVWIVSSQDKTPASLWTWITGNPPNPVTSGTGPVNEEPLAEKWRVKEQYLLGAQEAEKGGEWEKAQQNYEKAQEIDPDDKLIVPALNKVKERLNKLDKEVQQFITVGNFYFSRGQYKEAIVEFEKAKALQPQKQEILTLLQRVQSAWDTEKKLGVALSQ